MKLSKTGTLCIAAFSMVILILDTKTALNSALLGMEVCLKSVLPSLFPFFFLSAIINDRLLGANVALIKPVASFCKIQSGGESLLLLGLIGGYPVGATCIQNAHRTGALSKDQADRMLAFCNNAGPAFLFGMLMPVFMNVTSVWALWFIHILSALIVGALIPKGKEGSVTVSHTPSLTPSQAMQSSLRSIGVVCGWVVLFRIIIGFFDRWFLWWVPQSVQVLICGLLELSNGCLSLSSISCLGIRFIYASIFLSFGGVCVCMQTSSVIGNLSMKTYLAGKALQTAISFILASIAQLFLFPNDHMPLSISISIAAILIICIPLLKKQ